MRERRLLVAAAVDDGEFAVFVEPLKFGHAAIPAKMLVDLEQLLRAYPQSRAVPVISVIAIRQQRVQPVVAARQRHHHQNALFASGILRQRLGGLPTTMRTLRTSPCFAPLTPVQTRKSGKVSHQTQGDGAIPQAQIETI